MGSEEYPLLIADPATGELDPACIFLAVLPCSWYTYAEACSDLKLDRWTLCHVHAFHFFSDVPGC